MTSTPLLRRARGAALLLAAAALLTACGSSDDRHETTPPPVVVTPTPPVSAIDAFFALVRARASQLLDNDEPVEIDSVTATAPETTEPEPLPST
ncbi:hypothetical protein [Massilia yuzhufengensis]|uniref:Uncharacterized protein n=1 Tax=Massilia yuzhufengensis TaxID=1164594 RepID=A0A1I1IKZ5_9BURK|nr:hypothetical protein [Massilia yuzhufengensis]SFC33890.1 hypothetical protein SAMN05216204_105165 [Massilia yuzhufengensis]